jgi:hypothetical protein
MDARMQLTHFLIFGEGSPTFHTPDIGLTLSRFFEGVIKIFVACSEPVLR